MNRLAVVHTDHSGDLGGAEMALRRVLGVPHGWNASVLVPRGEGRPDGAFGDVRLVGIRMRQTGPQQPGGAATSRSPLALAGLLGRVLAQSLVLPWTPEWRRAQLAYANSTRAAVYTALAARLTRKPLVLHVRDMVTPEGLGRGGFALFTRIALPAADGLIANSGATLASAAPYIRPGTPTEVIPSPIDITRHRREPGRPLRAVGMVARLDPWKGQQLLLTAFAAVFAGRDVRLVLAGGTPFGKETYRAELEELATSLGIAEQVDFLGHVTDVAAVVDELDICVQCSDRPEPLGQNVLQYLARGAAVVVADEGGPLEWVREGVNGLLFTMGDADALAAALRRLDTDPALRERLQRGAAATELLTDTEIASITGGFLSSVARSRGREP